MFSMWAQWACRKFWSTRECVGHQVLSGGLWPRMSGGRLVVTNQWTTYHLGSCSRNAFPHKKCQLKCWGHFFLCETVLSTLWWKLIEITDSVEMHPFYQDILTWCTKIPFSRFWQMRNEDVFLRNNFPDCSCMLTWHCIFASFPNNSKKKKKTTLLPKYITCSNTS